ncbi:uncharacterized protein CcaverHIS019_0300170 [Cutaneotrichosporon cavernicola]|uniref:Mid2 domain-containing protein n=1 Tax=Cutaneotrichosporon cavernicola TaxID=279322 RepID=A0AA48L225_9TREE|nr:uncharacterized protein CcaverHIS019_0300170 [Cutaneotrichosporon cavernicola]BEI89947.1 hypothetical protein CcaverHIS019_0300170 [Cutaneotrichosporon cavernicola]BEI97720.1 hypothetical protein CcaverHIS631_0300190 [Cutaneotrichosporon cavernicola]BEJ05497.1 hypothetical protein CcaverHIS641_0300190 [Cutaneotrichosporon cavernicola]
MSSLNGWGLTLTYFLVVVISLVAAKPTLKLTTSRISQCVDIEFQYGGGTPPYTFNAVAAFLPSQTLRLDQSSGTASWNCVFPRFNQATKKTTQLTFFIEDSNGDFSSATTLLDVNENPGISCSIYQDPPFQFRWSDSMGGSGPGAIVPQCKSLSLTTVMAANQNITVNLPLVLIGIVPGGDVWKTTGAPDTSELTLPLNVEAGNQVVFTMRDYQKHQGGSTDIMSVVSGTECGVLHSRPSPISASKSSSLSGGTIAGIAIGGAAALAIVCLSIFACFWWRRRTAAKKVSYAQAPVDLAEPDPYFGPNGPPMQVIRSPTDLNPNLQFQGTKLNEGHGSYVRSTGSTTETSSAVGYYQAAPLPSSVRGPLSHKSVPSSFSGSLPGTAVFAIGDPTVNVNDVQPTYRIQEDAGPVPQVLASASDQIVDMPPTYNPTWSASQGRPRRQVKTPAHTTDHMGAHANDRA